MGGLSIFASIENLSANVREGFDGVGTSLDNIKAQACMGSAECKIAFDGLHAALVEQKKSGKLQTDAINISMAALGANHSSDLQALQASLAKVGETSSQKDNDLKLEMLIDMVKGIKDDIGSMGRNVEFLTDLALAKTGLPFPSTFVIKPKPRLESLSTNSSSASKMKNYFQRKLQNNVMPLLWTESILIFVCPVTLQEVPCGPDDMGYPISVPTTAFKAIVPALRFGLVALKIGLSTQGLGAVVPNVEGLLPAMAGPYLDALNGFVAEQIDAKFGSVDEYLAEAVSAEALGEAMKAIEPFIRRAEGASADDKEWESTMCGLNRIVSKDKGKSVCWVSDDAMPEFKKNGKAALSASFKV